MLELYFVIVVGLLFRTEKWDTFFLFEMLYFQNRTIRFERNCFYRLRPPGGLKLEIYEAFGYDEVTNEAGCAARRTITRDGVQVSWFYHADVRVLHQKS